MTVELHDSAKLIAWIENQLGGKIERWERQVRWRPGWFADLRRGPDLVPLYVRGDRNEDFPPWPLEYERDILQLLQKSAVPVPKIYGFCPNPRAIVLERVSGRPNLSTAENGEEKLAVLNELAQHMASMHALDIGPFRAAGIKMPQTAEERAVPFFLEGEKLYLRYKKAPDPRMEFIRRWIHRNVPEGRTEVCFLHGDPGQFLFRDGRITAMLDFEWACLGDPLMDLGGLRLRAIHEPMGDIAPLFQRYQALTGRAIERDVLGFHTIAFIANTSLAISPAVANPKAGVDYPEYVNWYIVSLLFTLSCMAEVLDIELKEPPPLTPRGPPRWASSFDVFASTFGDKPAEASNGEGTDAAFRRTLAGSLAKFTRKQVLARDSLDDEYVAGTSAMVGKALDGWEEADAQLESFVVTAGPESDEQLIRLLHRWAWRQVSLLDGVSSNEMWKLRVQPMAELLRG